MNIKKIIAEQLSPILLSAFEDWFSPSDHVTRRHVSYSSTRKKSSFLNMENKMLCVNQSVRADFAFNSGWGSGWLHSFSNISCPFNILNGPTPPNVPEVLQSLDTEKAFDQVE